MDSDDVSMDTSDLATIWKAAVREYEARTGKSMDPQFVTFRNMEEVMRGTEKESQIFGGFRREPGKVAKVRTAFGNNLGTIQKVLSGIEAVGYVASVFPPAMPVSLVFMAFGHVLQSFAAVKADYDKVERFFENSQRFLDRLSILEKKTPSHGAFIRCVTRVFSCILSICAIAQDCAKEEKRFKKWLSALWDGTDSDLEAAYSEMEIAIEELGQAVGFATFREIRETREELHIVDGKVDRVHSTVLEIHERVGATNDGIRHIDQNITGVKTEIQKMTKAFTESLKETQSQNLREMSRLNAQEPQNAQKGHSSSKMEVSEKRHAALDEIRRYFANGGKFDFWSDTRAKLKAQKKGFREDFVPGTAKWLFKEARFMDWVEGKNPVLWVTGDEGTGKSFLAYAAAEELQKRLDDQERTSVAYFCFREEETSLQSVENCLACLALQIAEHDAKYRDQLRAELKRETDETTWQRYFTNRYTAKSDARLFLILDGLDEMTDEEAQASTTLIQYLTQREEGDTHIRILLSCRRSLEKSLEPLRPEVLELTRDKLSHDMTLLIKARFNSLARLKKFPRPVLRTILTKVKSKADGMLYIEHMLRRLSYIGRQGAVLKDLEKNLPDNLQALYQLLLDECHKGRTDVQYKALKRLFAWLAYSKRSLTLEEAGCLVQMTVPDGSFDVEDEILGRSARILELARILDDEEEGNDDGEGDGDYVIDKVDLDQLGNEGSNLTFQERSLREFFKAVDVDDNGLRTPPSSAHLTIFEMATSTMIAAAQKFSRKDAPAITSYAARYWYDHLVDIDLEKATDLEVIRVLNALHNVLSNTHNVSKVIETFELEENDTYPTSGAPEKVTWIDVMMKWVARGVSLKDDNLASKTKEWIQHISENPKDALVPLARGHITNWYEAQTRWTISWAFHFANAALQVWTPKMEELTLAEVQRVANAFPDIQGGVSAKRATGSLLTWVENDKAAEYLTEAFDEFPADSSKDKFCSGWLLSYALENLDKRQEAVETIDKALAVLPANWKEDSDFSEWVIWVLHEKADLLNYLDKGREAIDAYNESRAVNPNNTIGGWCLESMRAILTPSNDPEGKRLLDMLRSWTVQERREFLDWVLRLTRSEAIQAVCRAVKMNNDEGMEFLNEIITDYEHSRPAKSAEIIFLHSELAGFYGHVIGDKKKAKKMYKDVLTTKIKEEDLEKLQSTLYTSRMELANIIFSEFLSSADPKEKTNLLEDMKKLPATSFAEEVEQDLDQSQVGVMLAIMLRTLGPAVEYHRHMQKVFQKCVDGLRDADGWNDGSSFRLLAKALAVMGGLERDVSIAMSCQFSLVSPDPAKSDGTSSESSENGDETSAAAQAEEADKPGDIGNLAQNDPTEETGVEGSLKPESTGESQNATTTPALNGSAEETPDQIESIIEKTTTTTFTIMTNDPNFAPDTTADASEDTEELQASDPPSASTNPVEPSDPTPSSEVLDSAKPTEPDNTGPDNPKLTLPDDEELEPTAWVGCDGDCGTAIESWETPMYYCIICACVDLCTSCHRKRLAQNLGAPSDSWKPYCGKDHKYIKGPMATWKGVKGGVMRIGNEEIPFKEWLKDLEEKRWKDAWTDFWKGGGGVKDIGF